MSVLPLGLLPLVGGGGVHGGKERMKPSHVLLPHWEHGKEEQECWWWLSSFFLMERCRYKVAVLLLVLLPSEGVGKKEILPSGLWGRMGAGRCSPPPPQF